ncbi:plasmid replication DNA-binding protein [Aeromonas sp. FDAARGOS 1402]|uniref:plasmid replication DNA-binding protein n=1 Tax=Aeromonas sp. FDAARGOS 1402 TaxID=2778051 RepID=UPI0020B268EF|nr:plasmid replication DNA-binding protein [Aeromonas sp. FDAARGOS 1402]
MPKTVKRRKNKLAGRYRNRWPDEAEISGRMIPKWVADSCRNRWPDHPEICNLLKRQVDILEKQLNQAIQRENQSLERESFYQEQIEAMQRLLEAPKANMTTFTDQSFKQDIATDPRSELATNYDELTTPQQDNKRIPIPEHVEPEQKKRGFLSRFFLPYG